MSQDEYDIDHYESKRLFFVFLEVTHWLTRFWRARRPRDNRRVRMNEKMLNTLFPYSQYEKDEGD